MRPTNTWASAIGYSQFEEHGLGKIQGFLPGDSHLIKVDVNTSIGTMVLMPASKIFFDVTRQANRLTAETRHGLD